jgi:hypothetical protein
MAPKATGRDRVIEKKLERRAADREREISPEVGEDFLMGGASDYHSELYRRKKAQEQKMFVCMCV